MPDSSEQYISFVTRIFRPKFQGIIIIPAWVQRKYPWLKNNKYAFVIQIRIPSEETKKCRTI